MQPRLSGLRNTCDLGWAKEQVMVIDEDLAITGSIVGNRAGFERMASEVALGRVGIILGIEVSRLARNNANWYRLLDLCAITDTLIGDSDGLYHPALFNDRLLLGLNRPDTQGTSYSTFCWTISIETVPQLGTRAWPGFGQSVAAADICDVLGGETPAKGAAQTGAIERCGDLCVGAAWRHFVNSGNGFGGRLERAFSGFRPNTVHLIRLPSGGTGLLACRWSGQMRSAYRNDRPGGLSHFGVRLSEQYWS